MDLTRPFSNTHAFHPNRLFSWGTALLLILLSFTAKGRTTPQAPAASPVIYQVGLAHRASHRVSVRMTVPKVRPPFTVAMPAWTPGAYHMEHWAKNVLLKKARCGGRSLTWQRLDRSRWLLALGGSGPSGFTCTAVMEYMVYANTLSDHGSHVDLGHAYLNGTSIFLYLPEETTRPARLNIALPVGFMAHTTLKRSASTRGNASFRARSYNDLVDAPISVGRPSRALVRTKGAAVEILFCGTDKQIPTRLKKDVARIFGWQALFMGGFPFRRYMILVHVWNKSRYVGLEHESSTSIIVPEKALEPGSKGYEVLLYIIAHELFHVWNIRRSGPSDLLPPRYDRAAPSPLLWWVEGLADYYAYRTLLKSGIWSSKRYLDELALLLTVAFHDPSRLPAESLADMGKAVWNPPQDPTRPLNLYPRSHLGALALDLHLLAQSGGRKGLDQVVKAMEQMARKGSRYIYTQKTLENLIFKVTGADPSGLFDRVARSRGNPLPADLLGSTGLVLRMKTHMIPPSLGLVGSLTRNGWRVLSVTPGSIAHASGIVFGDLITKVNKRPFAGSWPKKLPTSLMVVLRRSGRVLRTRLNVKPRAFRRFLLLPSSSISSKTKAALSRFLSPG